MPEDQQQNYQEQLESDRALSQSESGEEENKDTNPQAPARMGTLMFAMLLILCVMADFVDIITAGTVGWLIGLFVDAILLLAVGLSKGGRKQFKRIIVGVIGDSIPILSVLPFRSVFLVWSFVKSRYELPTQLGLSENRQSELGE